MTALSPSLYAANPLLIRDEMEAVASYSESFHLDVMDGQFAPEFGLNLSFIRELAAATSIPLDVHLMLARPMQTVVRVASMGLRSIAVHVEIEEDFRAVVATVRGHGVKAYAALRHTTPVTVLSDLEGAVDGCLLLTAPAGGGTFDEHAFNRLAQRPAGLYTVVDGKIAPEHFDRLNDLRVDLAVLGAALFKDDQTARRAAEFSRMLKGTTSLDRV